MRPSQRGGKLSAREIWAILIGLVAVIVANYFALMAYTAIGHP